jgi:hypothetical protein
MKKLLSIITISTLFAVPLFSQEVDKIEKLEKLENNSDTVVNNDKPVLEIGDKVFSIRETGDETIINLGKKEYRVVENNDGLTVWKSKKDGEDKELHHRHENRFRGHLGGLELGFNGLLTEYWSTSLAPEDNYFDINTAKSYNWNFILPSISIGMSRHLGFVTALGLSFNKYRFDGNNSIVKDDNGVIGPYYPDPSITYSKSKLVTTYATLPILLEGQIPVNGSNNTINIGAGVIGAVKLGSHTKVVYYTDDKQKKKHKDDFSLNVLRWGATARIGYKFFQIYGTTYFTSLFEEGKGPELYPFEVGIAFTFND